MQDFRKRHVVIGDAVPTTSVEVDKIQPENNLREKDKKDVNDGRDGKQGEG